MKKVFPFMLKQKKAMEYMITIWVIITLNFMLPRLMPGDPFIFLSGEEGEDIAVFSEAQRQYYFQQYNFDKPLAVQYGRYLTGLFKADLGYSIYYNESVLNIIARRLPWTLFLVTAAVAISTFSGTILGAVSAGARHLWADHVFFLGFIIISEIPAFLLGLVLLFVFAAQMGIFPLSGAMTHFCHHMTLGQKISDIAMHAALPVATLAIVRIGGIYLLARNSIVTVLARDYIVTARALGKIRVFRRHTLRNAMLPIVTRVFLSLGALVGGAILVENVFNYPGLGRLMREAVMVHDYPLIQGIFMVVTLTVLSANLMADFIYKRIDPRVETCIRSARRGL
jgi:peptide/nickel transport system permease protein